MTGSAGNGNTYGGFHGEQIVGNFSAPAMAITEIFSTEHTEYTEKRKQYKMRLLFYVPCIPCVPWKNPLLDNIPRSAKLSLHDFPSSRQQAGYRPPGSEVRSEFEGVEIPFVIDENSPAVIDLGKIRLQAL